MPTKICSRCGVEKSVEEFGIVRRSKGGYRNICKVCFNRDYQQTPKAREYQKKYREDPENKKKIKEYQKQPKIIAYQKEYSQRPSVKANQKDYMKKPKMLEYRKNYNQLPEVKQMRKGYQNTPEWKAAHCKVMHKRRAKIKDLEYSLTYEQWERIIELQGNMCNICGKRFTIEDPATRDHIIPASKSGPYTRENIQAVHKDCNSKKKDKLDKTNIVVWINGGIALLEPT